MSFWNEMGWSDTVSARLAAAVPQRPGAIPGRVCWVAAHHKLVSARVRHGCGPSPGVAWCCGRALRAVLLSFGVL